MQLFATFTPSNPPPMVRQIKQWRARRSVSRAVGSFDARGLIRAVVQGDAASLQNLLDAGISPDVADAQGAPALVLAAASGNAELVALLLAGAQSNLPDPDGHTALMVAARSGNVKTTALLLEHHADPNRRTPDGQTALMFTQSVTLAKMLMEAGAHPDHKDEQGKTALMLAVENGHTGVAKVLLEEGADPNVRDLDGKTALDAEGISPGLIKILRNAGGKTASELLTETEQPKQGTTLESLVAVLETMSLSPTQLGSLLENARSIKIGDDTLEMLKQELHWVLELLVELKRIGVSVRDIAAATDGEELNTVRKIQAQLMVLAKGFADYLEQVAREKCAVDILTPAGPPGKQESFLLQWLVKESCQVEAGELLCELKQGENIRKIHAEKAGILIHKAWKNDRLIAGTVLGRIEPLPQIQEQKQDEPAVPHP